MAVVIDGTTGISTPANTVLGNLSYTGTLTGNEGIVNLGSGQVYKDASGNVGIGTSSPGAKLESLVTSIGAPSLRLRYNAASYYFDASMDANGNTVFMVPAANGVTSGNLLFGAGGAERARIDSSGNLLVGTTSTLSGNTFAGLNGNAAATFKAPSTASYSLVYFNNGSYVGSIVTNGSTTSYVTSSDYRLKEAIAPMTGALARVAALRPCTYKWKVDGSDGQGFIAHELAEVVAGCVTGEKDAVDADGNPQYQGIDTSFLVATLAAAIQELKAIVDEQATRITALEGTAA